MQSALVMLDYIFKGKTSSCGDDDSVTTHEYKS